MDVAVLILKLCPLPFCPHVVGQLGSQKVERKNTRSFRSALDLKVYHVQSIPINKARDTEISIIMGFLVQKFTSRKYLF